MDFNQLLRESQRLEAQMEGVSSAMRARPNGTAGPAGGAATQAAGAIGVHALRVPSLTRSLAQLDAASAKMARAQAAAPLPAASDSRAQLLLAARGIDVRKQARALKELQQTQPSRAAAAAGAVTGPLPIDQFHPLDIERFLQQQQQLLCHQAMEDAAKVTSETYRRHDLASLDEDWESSKRSILDGLGFAQGKDAIAQAAGAAHAQAQAYDEQTRRQTQGGMAAPGAHYAQPIGASGPVLGMEQAIYARSVQELNRARVSRQLVPLLSMLRSSAAAVDEFFQRQSSSMGGGGDAASSAHQNMSANGLAVGDVTDCWDVLRFMLRRECDSAAGAGADAPLVEKEFAAAYEAPPNSVEGARFRSARIDGAKAYSESLFSAYIKRVVAAHPEARRSGGAGGAHQGRSAFARQVAAYVSVLGDKLPAACREVQLEGLPLWPQVYYCFRGGAVADALQLLSVALEQSGGMGSGARMGGFGGGISAHHSEQVSRVFVESMEKRATGDRSLSASLWVSLHEEYQRELSSAVNAARAHQVSSAHAGSFLDPFKLALYHLLGRFQLPSHVDLSAMVAPTTEDYLWLKLSLLHEGAAGGSDALVVVPPGLRDHVDAASMRLADLQSGLLARGEGAFNPDGRHPLAYFKVLLLSQQFEQAVYFLIKTAHFTVGVHFAVALHYAGCLHEHSNSKQELLVALSAPGAAGAGAGATFALNYSRVLRKYVESFVRSHPLEAFHYLYLLHPVSGAGANKSAAAARARAAGLGSSNTSFGLLTPGPNDSGMDDGALDSGAVAAASMSTDPSFPALRDLLLETREFDLLVGSIVPAGGTQAAMLNGSGAGADSIQTSRGLVYTYFSRADAAALLVATGGELEAHGLQLDAIRLYLLAYRFDLAVELSLKALAPLVATGVHSEERQGVVSAAQTVQRVVRALQEAGQLDRSSRVVDATPLSLRALHQLLCLVNYFDLYHLGPGKYDDALSVLSHPDVNLVPFESAGVSDAAALFLNDGATHVQVRRTLAHVAVSLMDVYWVHFQMIKRDMHQTSMYQAAHLQRDHDKQQIDSDVYAKIISIESLMA